jgi:RNA polymerase sigma-70 factor (ECF subfamily)
VLSAAAASDDSQVSVGELARQACDDRRAAERLLRRVLPRVRNLVRYLIRGDDEVDDIAQEALLAVLKGLPTFRGEGAFDAWVDRITARVTFTELPRRRRSPARPSRKAVDLALLPASSIQIEEYLSRRRVVELLDRLPNAQRHALVLHHVLGHTVPEIAEELSVPAETVRSRLRLGRARMEALFRGKMPPDDTDDDDARVDDSRANV